MRSLVTGALVAALALLALAAAVDALRAGRSASEATPLRAEALTPQPPCPKAVAAMFRGQGGTMACAPAKQRRLGV